MTELVANIDAKLDDIVALLCVHIIQNNALAFAPLLILVMPLHTYWFCSN